VNPLILAVCIPAACVTVTAVAILIARPFIDGPNRSIVVVDTRTYRLALRRIQDAVDLGDDFRAYAGATAARQWLLSQVRTGPKRHRARYAAALEQIELRLEELRPAAGIA
jgi:hypothetical protein